MIKLLKRHKGKLILSVLTMVLLFGFSNSNRYFEIAKNLDIFATLYKETNAFYVDEINPSKLINVGVEEMLASLDPYTVYISEDRIEDFKTLNAGQYGGVGAETVRIGEELFISMVNEGSVADQQGVEVGDKIISVDDQPVAGVVLA
jgi:carboxyl-terminal processing protease